MKKLFGLLLVITFVVFVSAKVITAQDSSMNATFGIAVDDYKNAETDLTTVQGLGLDVRTVSIFVAFGDIPDFTQFKSLKDQDINLQMTIEAWDQSLDSIAKGVQDNYLKYLSDAIFAYGGKVTIRLFHEFNGGWYPWGNKNDPEVFKQAFRHVVSIFPPSHPNVLFMWCPNVLIGDEDLSKWYPGDDVVDENGIDGYNWGDTDPTWSTWQSPSQVFDKTYQAVVQISKKPIVIAETSSAEDKNDPERKGEWFTEMGSWLKSHPDVVGFVVFNIKKEADWRIDSSEMSLKALVSLFGVVNSQVQTNTVPTVTATPSFSLIPNGDFGSLVNGWPEHWNKNDVDTILPIEGSTGIKIVRGSKNAMVYSDQVPVVAGETYTWTTNLTVTDGKGEIGWYIDEYTATHEYVKSNPWMGAIKSGPYKGTQTFDYTPTDSTVAFASFQIYMKADGSFDAEVYSTSIVAK